MINERPTVSSEPIDEPPPPSLLRQQPSHVAQAISKSLEGEAEDVSGKFDLQVIPGVTRAIQLQMEQMGIETPEDVLAFGVENLVKFKGVAKVRAETIISGVEEMLAEVDSDE